MNTQDGAGPLVSIVIPMRNEERFIRSCLESIVAQDFPPGQMEVIVADGMSTDGSRDIVTAFAREHPFVLLVDNPARTTGPALNTAIRRARGRYVLRADAHAAYAPDYVREVVRFLEASGAENVGGPLVTLPGADTLMARCVSSITSNRWVVGGSAFRTDMRARYSDGCFFGAWPRTLFDQIGGFNEALTRHQDNEFNSRIMRYGGKIFQTPKIRVTYYNQATLRGLLRQAFRNGVWHELAVVANPAAFKLRYFAPFAFVMWMVGFALLSWAHPAFFVPLLVGGLIYAAFLAAVGAQIARRHGWQLAWIVPCAVCAYHAAYGFGTLLGIFRFWILGADARRRARAGSRIPNPDEPPRLGARARPVEELVDL